MLLLENFRDNLAGKDFVKYVYCLLGNDSLIQVKAINFMKGIIKFEHNFQIEVFLNGY